MKTLKRTFIFLATIVFLLLINVMQLKAQPGTPTACDSDPDVECPIDTPVVLLAAAILFLSVKKITDVKNQKNMA